MCTGTNYILKCGHREVLYNGNSLCLTQCKVALGRTFRVDDRCEPCQDRYDEELLRINAEWDGMRTGLLQVWKEATQKGWRVDGVLECLKWNDGVRAEALKELERRMFLS